MADDFQIQQKQTSVTPYVATGATLGALGGGAGAYFLTRPKYGSLEDIVEETNDKDKFEKKITDAPDEDKQFLKDVREYAGKEEAAGAEYDRLLEEYKTANAGTGEKIETDAYKEKVKAESDAKTAFTNAEKAANDAEAAYNNKKADLTTKETNIANKRTALEAEVVEVRGPKKPAHPALQKKINNVNKLIQAEEQRLREIPENFNNVFRQHAEELSKLNGKKLERKWAYVEQNINSMVERMPFTGTKEEIKAAREAKAKEIRQYLQDVVAEFDHNTGRLNVNVPQILKTKNDAYQSIKDVTKQDMSKAKPEELAKQVGRFRGAEARKVEKLEKLLNAYKEYAAKAKATGEPVVTIREFSAVLFDKEFKLPGKLKISEYNEQQLKTFFEGLTDKDKETLKRLVGENADEKAIETAIKGHKDKIAKLDKALADINASNAKIVQYGGEGAYIRNGVIYRADGTKADFKPKQIKLADRVEIPTSKEKLEGLQKQLRGLESQIQGDVTRTPKYTAEQINELLANDTVELEELRKQVAQEKQKFDQAATAKQTAADAKQAAETARQSAYDALETKPAKTVEELTTEFNKNHSVSDRAEFVKNKANAAKDDIVKKYGEQLKRKWGFAEHTNAKIAATALGAAAVFGGLFALFAPKDEA